MEGALLWVAEKRAMQGCSQTPPPPESSAHSLPTVLIHVHSSWNKGWCSAGGLSPLSPLHFCMILLPAFPIAGNSI